MWKRITCYFPGFTDTLRVALPAGGLPTNVTP
jgi:hypothetical protein